MPRFPTAAILAVALGSTGAAIPAMAQFEAESVAYFRASDVDGDERLTLPEFRTFIRYMADAGAPMSERIQRLAAYRVAFARVDANGDGLATPEELRAAERTN